MIKSYLLHGPGHRVGLKILLLAAALSLPLGFSAGCSDDEETGAQKPINPAPDASPEDDADVSEPEEDTQQPSALDLAATLEVSITPPRALYNPNTVVQTAATVYDGRGAPMPAQAVTWSAEPADAVTEQNPGFRLERPGAVTFKACTNANGMAGAPVCGTKRILVKKSVPAITITSPDPGAWLGDDGLDILTVAGSVTDPDGELRAFVNGQEVALDASGNFSTTLTPHFGINHIEVVATDGVSFNQQEAMLDVLWAPAWYAMNNSGTQTAFHFDDGLVLDLGQRLFDDRQPPAQVNESTYRTDDLADILALFIKNIDFMSQLPNPVLDSGGATLHIDALTFADPVVMLDLTDQGADLYIWVPQVEIQTTGQVSLDTQMLNLDGSITTDLAGFAALHISKPAPGADFVANVDQLNLALQNAESHFAAPEANAIFRLAESALRAKIEDILADTLRDQFIDQLPSLLSGALNSIEAQISGLSFDLDTGFTTPLTLGLNGKIDRFQTTYREAMTAVLSMDVAADQPPMFTHTPGIPMAAPYSSDLPLFRSSRAQVGVRLALLNGLLHTLWETGFLEIDLTDLMPEQYAALVQKAQLSTKLQPVLSRPRAGEPYDFILSAGQMEIEAEMLAQVDTYAINIEVGILMSLENNAISLIIPDKPTLKVWEKSTTADATVLPKETIEMLILTEVWPQIEDTLRQGLSFELPVPSLSGLADLAPSMSALQVAFLPARPVTLRDGFIIFDIKLEGSIPNDATPAP